MASQTHELQFYQAEGIADIDAFTDRAFGGNPAAVVLLPQAVLPLDDAVRQQVAAENNLSETAYLECAGDAFAAADRFKLRWFTPAIEVPLCGHATLAAAAALFFGERNPSPSLTFETASGKLVVTRQAAAAAAGAGGPGSGPGGGELLSMDLPLVEASAEAVPPGMEAVVQAAACGMPVAEVLYAPALRYLVVVLAGDGNDTRHRLRRLAPSSQALADAHTGGLLVGVIMTAQGDGTRHHFLSRFFGPWAGIAEDPVTGSAHAVTGPYWAQRLGVQRLRAQQCSPRGGELLVDVRRGEGRVTVAGQAVMTIRGSLLLPAAC